MGAAVVRLTLNEIHTGNMAIHITFFTQFLWQFTHDSHTTHKICFVRLRRTLPLLVVLSLTQARPSPQGGADGLAEAGRAVEGDADVLVPQLDDLLAVLARLDLGDVGLEVADMSDRLLYQFEKQLDQQDAINIALAQYACPSCGKTNLSATLVPPIGAGLGCGCSYHTPIDLD
jgi:hypothetical protein